MAKKGVTFKVDKQAVAKLAHSNETKKAVVDRTKAVEGAAKRLAPLKSGRYRAGIKGTVEKTPKGWVGRVDANHFTSAWIEFGTLRTRAFAPLRRATEAVFGTIESEDK